MLQLLSGLWHTGMAVGQKEVRYDLKPTKEVPVYHTSILAYTVSLRALQATVVKAMDSSMVEPSSILVVTIGSVAPAHKCCAPIRHTDLLTAYTSRLDATSRSTVYEQ